MAGPDGRAVGGHGIERVCDREYAGAQWDLITLKVGDNRFRRKLLVGVNDLRRFRSGTEFC